MSSDMLAGIAGVALALALSYIPGLGTWFNKQESGVKVMVTGLLLVLVAIGVYVAACTGLGVDLNIQVSCSRAGGIILLSALLNALLANQAAYVALVKPFVRNNPGA